MRGPEAFEVIIKDARAKELESGNDTASNELHEAIKDLSRRPKPDSTGAIQHAMASLECVARELSGARNANLGEILKRGQVEIPQPLGEAVKKAWGLPLNLGGISVKAESLNNLKRNLSLEYALLWGISCCRLSPTECLS
jgi:hypothetical protein